MSKKPKVMVLRTAGTNCDLETAAAFEASGASVERVHINQLVEGAHGRANRQFDDYHILAIPGGFTYGDDIESGRILANELRLQLGEKIAKFIADGKLVIGICNGFQVLVRAHILPGLHAGGASQQTATLTNNDSGKFEDRWVTLKSEGKSVWTRGLGERLYLPVAHAEGKFVADKAVLEQLNKNAQVAFRYCAPDGKLPRYPENPNGSLEHIAGITDRSGRVLGLMPHPERHFYFRHHPRWGRMERAAKFGDGARIFCNGVEYVKEKLL
jgi:phosphoribosylformylglycinamidine synthase